MKGIWDKFFDLKELFPPGFLFTLCSRSPSFACSFWLVQVRCAHGRVAHTWHGTTIARNGTGRVS